MVTTTAKVHSKYFEFCPGFKKEAEVFENDGKIRGFEVRGGIITKKRVERTYPREPNGLETAYKNFMKKITDKSGKTFNPRRDDRGVPIRGTGASFVVNVITRFRTKEGKEFLYTKGRIKGYDSMGDPVSLYCPFSERWERTFFNYKRKWDDEDKRIVNECLGPSGSEMVYDLPFNEKNVRELWNNRESDNVGFLLKDEESQEARDVRDVTGISHKTLDLFVSKSFNYLWNAEFIPQAIKDELRQQAQIRGHIKPPGPIKPSTTNADYSSTDTYTSTRSQPRPSADGIA